MNNKQHLESGPLPSSTLGAASSSLNYDLELDFLPDLDQSVHLTPCEKKEVSQASPGQSALPIPKTTALPPLHSSTPTKASPNIPENTRAPLSLSLTPTIADRTLDERDIANITDAEGNELMWLPALNLTMKDKYILLSSTAWLNDTLIRASLMCLRKQFCGYGGLGDPLLVEALKLKCKNEIFAQVVLHRNCHWAAVSNKTCSEGTVKLYDSLQWTPDANLKKKIASMACFDNPQIVIECMNVQKQSGADDCGLMAIAYTTSLLFDQDPVNIRFDQKQMRNHLLQCLESGKICPFPVLSYRSIRKQVLQRITEELYCTCRQVYVDGDNMIQCTTCHNWLHSSCEGLKHSVFKRLGQKEKSTYKCSLCK